MYSTALMLATKDIDGDGGASRGLTIGPDRCQYWASSERCLRATNLFELSPLPVARPVDNPSPGPNTLDRIGASFGWLNFSHHLFRPPLAAVPRSARDGLIVM